jgi:ribosomal protein S18 acetylase RimI-like enzyme
VRPYRAADRAAIYEICLRTGDAGNDATGKYQLPDLLGDIYVGPYLYLEPELAFVLDDGQRPVGYVLGTASTPNFVRAYRQKWLPRIAGLYDGPSGSPATPDEELLEVLHNPEHMLVPELGDYPAHLHIDILAEHRGYGHGRSLMETFFRAAAASGAAGVSLGVDPANTGAEAFYLRLGFQRVDVSGPGHAHYFGRSLAS